MCCAPDTPWQNNSLYHHLEFLHYPGICLLVSFLIFSKDITLHFNPIVVLTLLAMSPGTVGLALLRLHMLYYLLSHHYVQNSREYLKEEKV